MDHCGEVCLRKQLNVIFQKALNLPTASSLSFSSLCPHPTPFPPLILLMAHSIFIVCVAEDILGLSVQWRGKRSEGEVDFFVLEENM